ncbi:MAG: hypothetical protein J0H67_08960 [Rhodospirillales bacterium]|nr:hypothetical protein [Rhodospirillales bacterium]
MVRSRRALLLCLLLAAPAAQAEPLLRDPNLPSVPPDVLRQVADMRARQAIMDESQAPYAGRCVCPLQTEDSNGKSCKGRFEKITRQPIPICRPQDVTREMLHAWWRKQA